MTRIKGSLFLLCLSSQAALAQTEAPATTSETPPVDAPAAVEPAAPPAAPTLTAEDREKLRNEIKAELREEMRAEIEKAARAAAQEKRSAQEWAEESWVEEVKPKLNFVDFDGYFRTRVDLFQRAHLGTYDPDTGKGTSNMPAPLNYRANGGDRYDTLTTANMRLRLDPTLNVSEDIRLRMTADIFDNFVLGGTPDTYPGITSNPNNPLTAFTQTQLAPERGFNNAWGDSIRIKRAWGEVTTPVGQVRFGRMASHFGLGILANDGNCLECDSGNNADRLMFITRILGHYVIPAVEFTGSGPWGRGGGPGPSAPQLFAPNEQGQPYDLDPRDSVMSFIVAIAKRDSPADIRERLNNGGFVLNYGAYGVYRYQTYDTPAWAQNGPSIQPQASSSDIVDRNAWATIGSLWGLFQWRKLKIEGEVAGIFGHIGNVQTIGGIRNEFILNPDGTTPHCYLLPNQNSFFRRGRPLPGEAGFNQNSVRWGTPDPSRGFIDLGEGACVRQLGFALEGSYSFLNDSLVIGGGLGYASGDDAWGMGIRSGSNNFQNTQRGDLDGRQFGGLNGDKASTDNTIENFRFHPDYRVDMLMFREVLGTVTDAAYIRPSVTYYILDGLGVRGDGIFAVAQYASSTPGHNNLLGAEANGSVFYKSEDGFYAGFTYAFMFPLAGFHHAKNADGSYTNVSPGLAQQYYGEAKFAQRFHGILGIQF